MISNRSFRATLAALLLTFMSTFALGTVDGAMCTTADAGAACSGTEVITSTNEEIGALDTRAPMKLGSVSGTNTIVASVTPTLTAYADLQTFYLKPANDITGAATLNINTIGAKAVVNASGSALSSGDLLATNIYIVIYYASGDHFRVLTNLGSGGFASASGAFIMQANSGSFSAERALTAGTAITLTDGGANSTMTVGVTAAAIGTTQIGTDGVSADELNATGVEAELEAVIDLQDLQGAVTAGQLTAIDTSAELRSLITDETGSGAAVFGTSPTITTDITIPNTGLHLLDTNASHDLIIAPGSNLTADHTLTVTTGDADRTLDISGASVTISAYIAGILDDANEATLKASINAEAGVDFQAFDSDLTTWAGVTPSANGQSLVSAANYAAMRGLLDLEAGTDFYSIAAADAAFQPIDADLTLLAAGSFTDPNLDQFVWWDDSQGRFEFATIADLATEAAPAAGDYITLYGAEGDVRKVDWSSLPGAGGGINNVSEDASPTLGGNLEGNAFSLGTSGSQASDVFLEEGGVINWDAGDCTLTQTGNSAAFGGCTLTGASVDAATTSAAGVSELATSAETETGTDTARTVTPAGLLAAISGKKTIALPAKAWTAETTTGCASGSSELANGIMQSSFDCDGAGSLQEGIQFFIPQMPKNWDEGTVTLQVSWTNASGTGDVLWLASCAAISNDDVMNASFGTEITITDSVTAALDLMISPVSSAITCSGTPAEGDAIVVRLQRDGDNASDTLNSVDARFLGANLFYNINAFTDD